MNKIDQLNLGISVMEQAIDIASKSSEVSQVDLAAMHFATSVITLKRDFMLFDLESRAIWLYVKALCSRAVDFPASSLFDLYEATAGIEEDLRKFIEARERLKDAMAPNLELPL